MAEKKPTKLQKKTDKIVASFTSELLGLAREADVDFEYAGNKGGLTEEINRVMKINAGVVNDLLTKTDD